MLSLRVLLTSAVSVLLLCASAAPSIPSSPSNPHIPDLINGTSTFPQESPQQLPNLTFLPWPAYPYQVILYPIVGFPELVIIYVRSFRGRHPVSVPALQDFVQDFRDNIEHQYRVPGYVPGLARQSLPDTESYTKWTIEINEGITGHTLPTEWALRALDELVRQLGSHGPANLFFSIKEGRTTYTYGLLIITSLGGPSLKPPLASEDDSFRAGLSI